MGILSRSGTGTFQLNDKCENMISGRNLYDNCHQVSPLDGEQGQLGARHNGAAEGQPSGKLQLRLRAARFIAPKASAEGACIFSKLVTMERV